MNTLSLTEAEKRAVTAAANVRVTVDTSPMSSFEAGFRAAKRFYIDPRNIAHMYPAIAELYPEWEGYKRAPADESTEAELRRLRHEVDRAEPSRDAYRKERDRLVAENAELRQSLENHANLLSQIKWYAETLDPGYVPEIEE